MPKYKVTLSKAAQKQLDKLSDTVADPILDAIATLASNPRPSGVKKLKGRDGYRIRKGDYRIIYDIHDYVLIVDVIAIGHRKDIYE
jgi:mRNA interferase RelE/StbE